jgi:DNA-binding transcriptional LysR family regulator
VNFKQLEYIVQIADTKNVTKAAENIFLSQSALNQQLLNLEKELGVELFYRSRGNWRLTEAGEIYVASARRCLEIKRDAYAKIADITDKQCSTLTIGLTPGRGITMFTAIYPKLHELYPSIFINPVEINVRNMQEEIAFGNLNIGFMTLPESQRTDDNYIILGQEEMVCIIPQDHALSHLANPSDQPLSTIDINLLKDDFFILMFGKSTNRIVCDEIFKDADFIPNILLETSNTNSIVKMVQSVHCCAIIPEYYAMHRPSNICCFRITKPAFWDLAISYRKNSYLNTALQSFIKLAAEYWNENLFMKKNLVPW